MMSGTTRLLVQLVVEPPRMSTILLDSARPTRFRQLPPAAAKRPRKGAEAKREDLRRLPKLYVDPDEPGAVQHEAARQDRARLAGAGIRGSVETLDVRVGEHRGVELRRILQIVVEPQRGRDRWHGPLLIECRRLVSS